MPYAIYWIAALAVCVLGLGITQMQIGPQIDPGVPWCCATAHPAAGTQTPLHLTLKSGNFGADDFFTRAFTVLPGARA